MAGFDPDAYLAQRPAAFDPDAYLAQTAPTAESNYARFIQQSGQASPRPLSADEMSRTGQLTTEPGAVTGESAQPLADEMAARQAHNLSPEGLKELLPLHPLQELYQQLPKPSDWRQVPGDLERIKQFLSTGEIPEDAPIRHPLSEETLSTLAQLGLPLLTGAPFLERGLEHGRGAEPAAEPARPETTQVAPSSPAQAPESPVGADVELADTMRRNAAQREIDAIAESLRGQRQASEAVEPMPPLEPRVSPETGFSFPPEGPPKEIQAEAGQQGAPVPVDVAEALRKVAVPQDEFQTGEAEAGQRDTAPASAAPVGVAEEPKAGAADGQGDSGRTDSQPAGTSNRVFGETYGEGQVPGGTGVDTGELLDNARAAIRSGDIDPYSILSKTRQKGIANPEEYAALAAEHERLVNDAVAKQKAGDPSAPEAVKQAEDFANAIQPHKTAASDLMRLFQGDLNYDLSTPFGMNEYMKAEIGRGMKPSEEPAFIKRANDINRAQSDVQQAVERSDKRVQTRYAKTRDIPIEEAAARVKQLLGDCLV